MISLRVSGKIIVTGFSLLSLFFSGCAVGSIKPHPASKKKPIKEKIIKVESEPYQFRYKPIIGSRNDDARTVVDMGVVLKIWVNSYKNRNGDLVASHDMYVWVKKPSFVTGATLPPVMHRSGVITPSGKLPFMFSNSEVDRRNIHSDENIKRYVNSYYSKEKKSNTEKTLKESTKFDNAIKSFINSVKKGEKHEVK